jgi:hypothetical protein
MVDASRNAIIGQVPATDGGCTSPTEPALVLMHGVHQPARPAPP